MRFGLMLFDINDAIREGDGKRLVYLYQLALLFYKCYGHTKYSYTCLLFLTNVIAILPKEKAESLISNRFCNNHGKIGKNISLDLRLEQLNNILKACLKVLGSNFCEASAQRVARSIGKIEEILQSIDKDCERHWEIKTRSKTDPTEAVTQIVSDLISQDAFVYTVGREGYQSFPHFNSNLLERLDYRDLHKWMKEKLSLWSNIYEK
jgi:serine palmitoyltransferase